MKNVKSTGINETNAEHINYAPSSTHNTKKGTLTRLPKPGG